MREYLSLCAFVSLLLIVGADESMKLLNDDFALSDNSTKELNSPTDFPFTSQLFPIYSNSNLPSNIQVEVEDNKDESSEIRQHPAKFPIPLSEHAAEHYHRDNNELIEERYNFGSYDFIRKRSNHEYKHRNKSVEESVLESKEHDNEVSEKRRLPQMVRLKDEMNGLKQQMIPWMPVKNDDVVQQNWWIETADPSNDTIITYGQLRRHKV